MTIAIASAFRNSVGYLRRYFKQIEELRDALALREHSVRLIAGEGDSIDKTREILTNYRGVDVQLVDTTHGGPVYGSTEQPERLRAMSKVGNAIFDAVKTTDTVVIYIESDLVWKATVLEELVTKALFKDEGFDVFAPLVFAGPHFYDIWGFRKDGVRFGPFPPYHPRLNGLTEVDSAGSCLAIRGDVARKCRIRNDYCLVGWCEDARLHGFRIAVCPHLRVNHP